MTKQIDLFNRSKEIIGTVLVDDEDYEMLRKRKWAMSKAGYATNTACQREYGTGYMHRIIAKCFDGMLVDHINKNTLDNRKENLRIADKRINAINSGKQSGIHWYKAYEKWQAYIDVDSKRVSLGYFSEYEDALKVRKEAEEKYHKPILERGVSLV